MKKPPNKADIRKQIEQQIDDFLHHGGEVKQIATGISGRESALSPLRPAPELFRGEKQSHTYVPDVVAAIEQRRQQAKAGDKPAPRKKKPRKKLIYDDFGEPLRWEWVED